MVRNLEGHDPREIHSETAKTNVQNEWVNRIFQTEQATADKTDDDLLVHKHT